ncbi:MAG TPA: hypothetical protein P5107_01525 [Thermotogota bacterium]|nr:hypothetical protein [Thermotogota bacterium]
MNIANEPSAAISVQAFSKNSQFKGKTEAYQGKVIAKSGKEISVLINDKVYKIEPGNAASIKIGDKIQVFFGKNLPIEISEEMLKKISGKLLDVFSLSLPYQTTKELEDIINQMPQNERLQFAKISNELVQMIETILKDDYDFHTLNESDTKNESFNLYDHSEPYNRRLVELSLRVKEMGKAWDQIPEEIKKEIVKRFVLFDLQKNHSAKEDAQKEPFIGEKFVFKNFNTQSSQQKLERDNLEDKVLDLKKTDSHKAMDSVQTQKKDEPLITSTNRRFLQPLKTFTDYSVKEERNHQQEDHTERTKKTLDTQNNKLSNQKLTISMTQETKDNSVINKTSLLTNESIQIKAAGESKAGKEAVQKIDTNDQDGVKNPQKNAPNIREDNTQIQILKFTKADTQRVVNALIQLNNTNKDDSKHFDVDDLLPSNKKNLKINSQKALILENQTTSKVLISHSDTNQIDGLKRIQFTVNHHFDDLHFQDKKKFNDFQIILDSKDNHEENSEFLSSRSEPFKSSNVDYSKTNEVSENAKAESSDNSQKLSIAFSSEDIRKIVDVLQNALSKPISLEMSLEQLEKKSPKTNIEIDETNSSSLPNQLRGLAIDHVNQKYDEKMLPYDKTANEFLHSFLSKNNYNMPVLFSAEAFEELIKTSLLSIEIDDMISSFKSYGVPSKEANHTTLDMVNLATRSIKEGDLAPHIYGSALKKYLKLQLPQLIVNHQIKQNDEDGMIKKIESFSKKAFMIIKAYAERLMTNKEKDLQSVTIKTDGKEDKTDHTPPLKADSRNQLSFESKEPLTKNVASWDSDISDSLKQKLEKDKIPLQQTELLSKATAEVKQKEGASESIQQKELNSNNATNQKNQQELNIQSEKSNLTDLKSNEAHYRNDIGSDKILKFLNISSEKPDYFTAYSSLLTINSHPFVIDLQQKMMNKGGYEKSEMYRVFIETNTQMFGTVFVDTVVTDKKIDIYIYAEQQYAKAFTNHSATLIKRIKETDYQLRGLYIREKLDQNGILKHKMNRFSNLNKKGGFYQFA